MANLIKNANWHEGVRFTPVYFSGPGYTYDAFYVSDCRTCSLTRNPYTREYTVMYYDLPIVVEGQKSFCYGYCMRAIESEHVALVAEFFNKSEELIDVTAKNVGGEIKSYFTRQNRCFDIPEGTYSMKLSLVFSGRVTACTFFAPKVSFVRVSNREVVPKQ